MMPQCIDSKTQFGITRRRLLAGGAALSAASLSMGIAPLHGSRGLVLAFIPQENPEKLIGDIEIICAYISKEIGAPVSGFVTADHSAAVEALPGLLVELQRFWRSTPLPEDETQE